MVLGVIPRLHRHQLDKDGQSDRVEDQAGRPEDEDDCVGHGSERGCVAQVHDEEHEEDACEREGEETGSAVCQDETNDFEDV